MATKCKVGGCPGAVPSQLEDQSVCLEHFLGDIQERCGNFSRQLQQSGYQNSLHQGAMQFVMLSAAKIATVGMENPPEDQLGRGRLLNAMLLLADLREMFDKANPKKPGS